MNAATIAPTCQWDGPPVTDQVRRILESACRFGAHQVTLSDTSGRVGLQVGHPPDSAAPGIAAPADIVETSTTVLVRGAAVAVVRATGHVHTGQTLEQITHLTARRLEDAWATAEEIENLAGEILRAYEELHLLYGLGEALTRQLSVAAGAEVIDLIVEKILGTVPAAWAELNLTDLGLVLRKNGQLAIASDEPTNAADQLLQTTLQSGGETLGTITLARPRKSEPFSSVDSKLLDAVGTLVANAIRNAQLYEKLRHQALHDALTSLPNRALLHDRLKEGIASERRTGRPLALLFMDLDRFKEVNDTFGHQYGDRLLQETASRLRGLLRESDTIARLGGDELAVLLPDTDVDGAIVAASKILKVQEQPFVIEGYTLNVGASIGIALSPQHGVDANTLMRHADVAMYVAKRSRCGYAIYAADQDRHAPSRLAFLSELRFAIEQDQLVVFYQPQADFKTGQVIRVEALVRWQHPRRGMVPPSEFIALAEQTGLIGPLTLWVLNAALRECGAWRKAGWDVGVSINLSAQNLHHPQLPGTVADLLQTWSVPASALWVEITESTLMADPAQALETLTSLSRAGVQISIDDYGTGYSSLAYLKRLPVDEIKIDRSFVSQMAKDDNDAAIVRSTVGLGHDLGLTVVAEGVESEMTWDLLASLGCDVAQGYYLSPPMPASRFIDWLSEVRNWSVKKGEEREND